MALESRPQAQGPQNTEGMSGLLTLKASNKIGYLGPVGF